MKMRIDGRELLVKKTTRSLVELQRQSGMDMSRMTAAELTPYNAAMAAFCALHNAGFTPSWEELLDRDTDDFEVVEEPGDNRPEVDAPDPPQPSPADSSPGDAKPNGPTPAV